MKGKEITECPPQESKRQLAEVVVVGMEGSAQRMSWSALDRFVVTVESNHQHQSYKR